MDRVQIPGYVKAVLSGLADAGYEAYAVGGCVRDSIIGRRPADWDVASAAPAERVMEIFPRTVPTGIKYGTVTVLIGRRRVEVTTFRKDSDYSDSRRPDTVEFISELHEDLMRRDFTINAMAMTADGEIIDHTDGRGDVRRRLIRTVGDPDSRFGEDALRMFRAVRFSAQLGFEIEKNTLDAIFRLSGTAKELSRERVRIELQKTLLSPRPERAVLMADTGLLDAFVSSRGRPGGQSRLSEVGSEGLYRMCAFSALLLRRGALERADQLAANLGMSVKNCRLITDACAAAPEMPSDMEEQRFFVIEHGEELSKLAAAAAVGMGRPGSYETMMSTVRWHDYIMPEELPVRGRDASRAGFKGPEIREIMVRLCKEVAAGTLELERRTLTVRMREIKRNGF